MQPKSNSVKYKKIFEQSIKYLQKKEQILFLTTSNRWIGEKTGEKPKSTMLAYRMAEKVGNEKVTVMDVPKMNIHPCEGNVSTARGNTCGVQKAVLKDGLKNPTGNHRCWASINNPDDELWKISKVLFESDCVVFFGSVRWGQVNSVYQKLIERLTWIENRHSSLGESNIIEDIDAGMILVGQNWHGSEIIQTQKQVLDFYGFHVVDELLWSWQYTDNAYDEREDSYQQTSKTFEETFLK